MKSLLVTVAFLSLVAAQKCRTARVPAVPACITQRIEAIKAQPRWNPPAEVHEYSYKGRRVFLFSADCCDQFTTLVDEGCDTICAPGGGITGKGDRRCEDFSREAKHVRLVWKDERAD